MLIDNNVLLDLTLNRPPHYRAARDLIDRIETTSTTAFVAWHTVATFYYIVQREINRGVAHNAVVRLTSFLTVAPTSHSSMLYALNLAMTDFEDAMQVAAAQAAGAQHIITRDIGDFTNSPIPAILPEQALRELF